MTLQTNIFDNGDFRLLAKLMPTPSPVDGLTLTITSKRQGSRFPDAEQVRFIACLEREGLQSLATLIQTALRQERTLQRVATSQKNATG